MTGEKDGVLLEGQAKSIALLLGMKTS